MNEDKIKELDSSIYSMAKGLNLLKHLDWPVGADGEFLVGWRKGNPKLPILQKSIPSFADKISALDALKNRCDVSNPIEKFLFDTADSYATASRMLENYGTKEFTHFSSMIYGRPDDIYENQSITAIDAANFLLETTENLLGNALIPKTTYDIDSQDFSEWIKDQLSDYFFDDKVKIVLDDKISAKALASSKKIKICQTSHFSELDKKQLLYHEAHIHTGTALNGKKQKNLKCLSLGSPRTTRTQEGLAVISELLTMSMDIMRLRRIALRVIAVKMALDGADFIEVFKYFLSNGQSEEDSVRSAQRIFRGGDVKNGVVFTKDSVYLEGLYEVQTFMRLAIWHDHPEYIQNLFSGRLTMADVIRLDPYFQTGWLSPPVYVPEWARDFRRLSALMAFSAFVTNIRLEKVTFERFIAHEEGLRLH